MAADSQPTWSRAVPQEATSPDTTPFDYIIVGSGAGGGPLAARLALSGRRVLVIEAGPDPLEGNAQQEVYDVPAYNGAATEDAVTSWDFSVRHYGADDRQRKDSKYSAERDPSANGGTGKGGIFYPRASALGGCTSHHAMIIIRPNDSDWDDIAKFTGDDSWRSENMQGYFPKIEQCLYYSVYKGFLGRILGGIFWLVQAIATLINPRRQLDPNGHGLKGWQPTSFIDPLVIASIARSDPTFLKLLFSVIWSALAGRGGRSVLKRAIANLQIIQFLDPNVRAEYLEDRARLTLISIGTDGKRRIGVREWLLDVRKRYPQHLVIETGAHATRIIFAKEDGTSTPRAIGVEVAFGTDLYEARKSGKVASKLGTAQYFAREEIIISGGSFNSPQLLMLSGIGDAAALRELGVKGPRDAAGKELAPRVDLPGVGRNLQDRYEVSVVSQMATEFSTLKGATFRPGDETDPIRARWHADMTGLYSTNGGALAMMMSSSFNTNKSNPDHFVFGLPAAFRGYYWRWSEELLRRTKDAPQDQRDLWTWVILKAYTNNNCGTVTLRTDNPFDVPEINFHSFSECANSGNDADALCEIVQRVREINDKIIGIKEEIQPGPPRANGSTELRDWVENEAWGHHACGTCRIGFDDWQFDVTKLKDQKAVLDSRFNVHGVRKLRVVDASVFPKIPGYFIVTPIFMIAEKAADAILADSPVYPGVIEEREAEAIRVRRAVAELDTASTAPAATRLPEDCVGLALSGGGIRSATYCLGMLQGMAVANLLRRIDFMSTVSGGGYTGGFLGRLYTRLAGVTSPARRVETALSNGNSPEIWWLRRNADYLGGAGLSDLEAALAIFARNLASVMFCVGALVLGVLGALRWASDHVLPAGAAGVMLAGYEVSPWWWVPVALLLVAILPLTIGYWLIPDSRSDRSFSSFGVLFWAVLLACSIAAVPIAAIGGWGFLAIAVLLLAWLWQDAVRWRVPEAAHDGQRGSPDGAAGYGLAALYRNRLARTLGTVLLMFAAVAVFVIVDTFARDASDGAVAPIMGGVLLVVAPFLPALRNLVVGQITARAKRAEAGTGPGPASIVLPIIAFSLALLLFFGLDVVAHAAFLWDERVGVWTVAAAFVVSLALGQWLNFLNLSSLQQQLTQKLARTFLGASNDARIHPTGTHSPVPVQVSSNEDDVSFGDYHPEVQGGPLHLVNVCVNQTVDHVSGRQLRENKGLPMCLGPAGISVAQRYHAVWERSAAPLPKNLSRVRALPIDPDPNRFHVLARSNADTADVEQLSLARWLAISAAALTTGSGRKSSLPLALLLGLLNVRLGYWWNSGIRGDRRPGRYPPDLWRRIKSLPSTLFAVQSMLLNEWRGYFEGPSAQRWYLSDGGHFDNSGLYELIRRRLPFIIAVDGSQDVLYRLEDLAVLTRQVRLDFCADITWLQPAAGAVGWVALDAAAHPATIPQWIKDLLPRPEVIGGLDAIKRDGPACAALAQISYDGGQDATDASRPKQSSWLLLVKANLGAEVRTDVKTYAAMNPNFPNQSTLDQFFGDDQWESYRSLGECTGRAIFTSKPQSTAFPGPGVAGAAVSQPQTSPAPVS